MARNSKKEKEKKEHFLTVEQSNLFSLLTETNKLGSIVSTKTKRKPICALIRLIEESSQGWSREPAQISRVKASRFPK